MYIYSFINAHIYSDNKLLTRAQRNHSAASVCRSSRKMY